MPEMQRTLYEEWTVRGFAGTVSVWKCPVDSPDLEDAGEVETVDQLVEVEVIEEAAHVASVVNEVEEV